MERSLTIYRFLGLIPLVLQFVQVMKLRDLRCLVEVEFGRPLTEEVLDGVESEIIRRCILSVRNRRAMRVLLNMADDVARRRLRAAVKRGLHDQGWSISPYSLKGWSKDLSTVKVREFVNFVRRDVRNAINTLSSADRPKGGVLAATTFLKSRRDSLLEKVEVLAQGDLTVLPMDSLEWVKNRHSRQRAVSDLRVVGSVPVKKPVQFRILSDSEVTKFKPVRSAEEAKALMDRLRAAGKIL